MNQHTSVIRAFLAWAFIVVLGCIFNADGAFFHADTHVDMLRHISRYGILACGMTIVIVSGGIDLSVGSVMGLAAVCFSMFSLQWGWSAAPAVAASLAIGGLAGLASGSLIARWHFQPFIATLAMMAFARGLAEAISGGEKISTAVQLKDGTFTYREAPAIFRALVARVAGAPVFVVTVIFLICVLLSWVVLRKLRWGRYLYAIGSSEEAARLSGVPIVAARLLAYGLAGLLSALAGICHAADEVQGDPQAGQTYELTAIAIVVIGGTSLAGGRGGIALTLLGTLTIGYIEKILSINAVPNAARLMLTGVIIVAAVLLQGVTVRWPWWPATSGKGRVWKAAIPLGVAALITLVIWAAAVLRRDLNDRAPPGGRNYTIGMSQCNLGEPWRVQMNADIRAAAEKHPELRVIFKDAQNDALKQKAQIEEFIGAGVDLLIVTPKEAAPLTPPVERAYREGIPVIVLDRKVLGDQYTCFISADNERIGYAAGRWIAKQLAPGAKVVELKGLTTSTPGQDRHSGFRRGIEGAGLDVVFEADMRWLEPNARQEMESALARFANIDLVYAHNDPGAHGAYLAAKAAGREKQIRFVGIDALQQEGQVYVKEGILAASFEYPTGGKEAIETALALFRGEKAPKEIVLSSRIFTPENVDAGGEQLP